MKLMFGEPKTPGTGGYALYDDTTVVGFLYTEENAAAIVAAVNHADALAEALRTVLPYVGTDAPFPRRVLDQAEAVLAAYAAAKEAQP